MDWVERFYSEYYFRPRVIWRMVSKAIFNSHERKRLTKEAKEYMALRSRRRKFISEQRQQATRLRECRRLAGPQYRPAKKRCASRRDYSRSSWFSAMWRETPPCATA